MSLSEDMFRFAHRMFPAKVAHAHCDIPCGIYDPHLAQIAALTVVRMNQLIEGLAAPTANAAPADRAAYVASLGRFVGAKEHPDRTDRFWDAMKLASAARQKNDMEAAQKLLAAVQDIAEIFWKTKGANVSRQPSRQTAGGELVYPA